MTTTIRLIDSHAHLDGKAFRKDRAAVLQRARDAGVIHVIQIGAHPHRWEEAVEIGRQNPDIHVVIGLPPHDCEEFDANLLSRLRTLVESNRDIVVGIGEIGLDYHYDMPKDRQHEAFRAQLELARDLQLPFSIHTRDANEDTLRFLSEEADIRGEALSGLIHCFSGDPPFAEQCLNLGLDISFSGIVTYKNAAGVLDAALSIPLDRMHIETDSPYLAPVPKRGRRCEPAFVRLTAEFIAGKRGIPLEVLAKHTTSNTIRLFRLPISISLNETKSEEPA